MSNTAKPFAAVWIRYGKIIGEVHQFATEQERNSFREGIQAQRDANAAGGYTNAQANPTTSDGTHGGCYNLPEHLDLLKEADRHYPTAAGTPSRMDQVKKALGL